MRKILLHNSIQTYKVTNFNQNLQLNVEISPHTRGFFM